jgi:hypothetical protein
MTDEEIKKFINDLREDKKFEEAYIGFFQFDEHSHESFIKANRQGLEIHAADLLEASITKYADKSKSFGLDEGIQDLEADIIFQFVDLQEGKKGDIKPTPIIKETWKDKVSNFGCTTLAILIVMLILTIGIVGLVTIFKWIF